MKPTRRGVLLLALATLVLSAVRGNAQTTCPAPVYGNSSFSYPAPPRPDPAEMGDGFFMATASSGKTSSTRDTQENTVYLDVTRHIPGVNGEGYLDPNLVPTLVSEGVISGTARISVGVSSVGNFWCNFDKMKDTRPPRRPPRVTVNGVDVARYRVSSQQGGYAEDKARTPGTFTGGEFDIPIEFIRFPTAPGIDGSLPVPASNDIRVSLSVGDESPPIEDCFYCRYNQYDTLVWASVQVKAMAPLLLVHGINANHEVWEKIGDDATLSAVTYLTQHHIPFAHKIDLGATSDIEKASERLAKQFVDRARELGAKAVHLVVHSKGGLDSRRFINTQYVETVLPEYGIKILSLSTLSTPHHGSILADLSVWNSDYSKVVVGIDDPDIEAYLRRDNQRDRVNGVVGIVPFAGFGFGPRGPGLRDLTTPVVQAFYSSYPFPFDSIRLYSYASDANLQEEVPPFITEQEAQPYLPSFLGRDRIEEVCTSSYRILRTYRGLTLNLESRAPRRGYRFTIRDAGSAPANSPNDLAVNDWSATYRGGAEIHVLFDNNYSNQSLPGRNHTTVKDDVVMGVVVAQIQRDFPVQ